MFIATQQKHNGGSRKGDPVNDLYIHEGWDAPLLKSEGLNCVPPVLHMSNSWDWDIIQETLINWCFSSR